MDLYMRRPNMDNIPQYDFPDGYTIHHWQTGDLQHWIDIQKRFHDTEVNEEGFHADYGHNEAFYKQRIYFLMHKEQVIGSISAWFGDEDRGTDVGQIHWLVIVPEHRGKNLSRPMMTYACNKFKELGHQSAYLETDIEFVPAVRLYLHFGFQPEITSDELQTEWDQFMKTWYS